MEKTEYKSLIYKAENQYNGTVYIGATTKSIDERKRDHINKSNNGSQNFFHTELRTYGPEAFTWEQIDTAISDDELAFKEVNYIYDFKQKGDVYNSDRGGGLNKRIYQYNLDGSFFKSYDSLENAGNAVNAYKTCIGNACLGQNKTCKGYYWSYNLSVPFSPEKDFRKKRVIQYSYSGKQIAVYESVSEASRKSGISKSCISRVCRGERDKSGGFVWKYD